MEKEGDYADFIFEEIKHISKKGTEFWYARELQKILEYDTWRSFEDTIKRAKMACENSGIPTNNHFADTSKMINLGKGAKRKINDIALTRYACYLVVQNGDPKKDAIALGQTYFAIKTRQQEISDNYNRLSEDEKRLAVREEMIEHNKSLAEAAKQAGVIDSKDYATFQNKGYQGLYGGLGAKEIRIRKRLKKSQKILDHMGSTELAANLFRATQTDEKLRRDKIKGKEKAYNTHYEVGAKVRQTIKELGGTMPEDLPTPEKSIQQIEKEHKKLVVDNKNE